jgi:hypothetical protein
MSKGKIVLDLRKVAMTPDQTATLHAALHKTVVGHLNAIARETSTGAAPVAQPAVREASLTVKITGTAAGDSTVTAILNGQSHTINKSGTIDLGAVKSGDIVGIQGSSQGTTTITIDVSADPAMLSFPPGAFNDDFFIN